MSIQGEETFVQACTEGRLEIVKLLLSLKGDRYIPAGFNSEYPFRIACENNRVKVVKYLLTLEGVDKLILKYLISLYLSNLLNGIK